MTKANKFVLIVDDEPIITKPLKRLFRRRLEKPYELVTNNNPLDALDYLEKCNGENSELAVVISDIMMPEMDGLDFLDATRGIFPDAARIVLTGYADKANAVRALNELELFHYIEKPWEDDEITRLLNRAIDKHRKDKMENMFRKYVPYEVIEEYVDRRDDAILGGQVIDSTVLFLDIVGFTRRTEKVSAEEIVETLNSYFTAVVETIHQRHGLLDKYMGDGLMALFGPPRSTGQPAEDACNAIMAANDIVYKTMEINKEWEKDGVMPLRIRIGLNSGKVVVGNIGSTTRVNYTAIGDVVNTASRIENIAYEFIQDDVACILLSRNTHELVKNMSILPSIEFEALGPIFLKGKENKVDVFKVLI